MNYFKLWLRFLYQSIHRKRRFGPHNIFDSAFDSEICLTVHDRNHEPDFCDKIRNEKNQGYSLMWSVTIS